MSNINWNQFVNNFANNFNRVNNNVQNMQMQQTPAQNPPQTDSAQTLFPNTTMQLNQTVMELAMLNRMQTINMLKDLLNFPKNFDQLLSQLTVNANQKNVQTALMLLSSGMNLSELSKLLQNNSKEAMTNLYQMLAQYNQLGVSLKDEQLSVLSKLISFVSLSSSSDVQSLKTTLLMYLPWLPLTDPDAFKLEIASGGSESSDSINDSITILISTENYGNLKADIYKTSEDGIKIETAVSESFPLKDFDILMKEESKKYNININIIYNKNSLFNKEKNDTAKTCVSMNTSPGVNPFLLLISTAVIKNVHEIDIKENLRELRKEKLDNGES